MEGAAEAGATSTLLAPDGGALWSLAGPVPWSPAGARPGGGFTVGGRLAAGPLLGLSDARDPLTGQELGPILRFPWSAPEWEPPAGEGPLADPDACSPAGWDPGSWAPESPWSTPLALLVAVGDLPDGGPRATRAPGLPWLPASVAPAVPEVLPDPLALEVDEEPLVELLVHALMAPTKPPTAQAIARALVPLPVPVLPPGLAPPTPY